MKTIIIAMGVVGFLLLGFGYVTGKSSNSDTAFSAIIPYVCGAILLGTDVLLVGVYALYRLFTS